MDALRKTLLAEGGRDGFDSYRVPGLAVTAAGTLLACCEGRIKEGDRRTLLLYRSTDDGATFAPRTVLAEPAPGQLLHNPMLLACRDGVWRCKAPDVPVKSTLGCGDTMVASLLLSLLEQAAPAEMLRRAVALSSANAMTFETAHIQPETYRELLPLCTADRLI